MIQSTDLMGLEPKNLRLIILKQKGASTITQNWTLTQNQNIKIKDN